jgi:hypothetical protein
MTSDSRQILTEARERADGIKAEAIRRVAAEDSTATQAEIAEAIGVDKSWVSRVINVDYNQQTRQTQGERARRSNARRALREASDEQVRDIVESLPPERQETIARALTVGDLVSGSETPEQMRQSISEPWAGTLIAKGDSWSNNLVQHIARWGLVLEPSASIEETLETVERIERRVAEVRAALQERIQDRNVA